MAGSDKSKTTSTSAADLTKASAEAPVELSEAALGDASGGAVFPSMPTFGIAKAGSTLKIDDPNLLLPAVQKG